MDDLDVDYYELRQMLHWTMSEDEYEEHETAEDAVAWWIPSIGLPRCIVMLAELERMYARLSTPQERRRVFWSGLGFLEDDGSNLDPLMATVELMLRDRIARGC